MKVVVTGTDPRLGERLRVEGFEVVECPLIRIEPLDGPPVQAGDYDWLVLTSRHGVEQLWRRLEGPLPRVAVVGPGTAEALRAHGVEPDLVARRSTQEGLVDELPRPAGRVLFAGAETTRLEVRTGKVRLTRRDDGASAEVSAGAEADFLLWLAIRFAATRTDRSARRLFFASISYLPVLLAAMIANRL